MTDDCFSCHSRIEKQERLFRTGIMSDAVLKLDTGRRIVEFEVHKIILAMSSSYFETLFFGGWVASTSADFTIREENAVAFGMLLELMYREDTSLGSIEECVELYTLADKYLFPEAVCFCRRYLTMFLVDEYVGLIYNLAKRHGDDELADACKSVWRIDTRDVISYGCLEQIDLEYAAELFEEHVLNIEDEMELFRAVQVNESWRRGEPSLLLGVLGKIRYLTMDPKTFTESVMASGLIDKKICTSILSNMNRPDSDVEMPDGFTSTRSDRKSDKDTTDYTFVVRDMFISQYLGRTQLLVKVDQNMFLYKIRFVRMQEHPIIRSLYIKDCDGNTIYTDYNISVNDIKGNEIMLKTPVFFIKNVQYLVECSSDVLSYCRGNNECTRGVEISVLSIYNHNVLSFTFKKNYPDEVSEL